MLSQDFQSNTFHVNIFIQIFSNNLDCWIDGDLSRENVSHKDVEKTDAKNVINSSDTIREMIAVDEGENGDKEQDQHHLHFTQVNSPLMTSQLGSLT